LKSWVAVARKRCELTQQQLAGLAGVSRQTVVELEKGNYNPSTALALRLAVLLDASVEELFQLPAEECIALRKLRSAGSGRISNEPNERGS
jgi:putative transcriptional regulator